MFWKQLFYALKKPLVIKLLTHTGDTNRIRLVIPIDILVNKWQSQADLEWPQSGKYPALQENLSASAYGP